MKTSSIDGLVHTSQPMIHRTKMPNLIRNLRKRKTPKRRSLAYLLRICQITQRKATFQVLDTSMGLIHAFEA